MPWHLHRNLVKVKVRKRASRTRSHACGLMYVSQTDKDIKCQVDRKMNDSHFSSISSTFLVPKTYRLLGFCQVKWTTGEILIIQLKSWHTLNPKPKPSHSQFARVPNSKPHTAQSWLADSRALLARSSTSNFLAQLRRDIELITKVQ